MVALNFRLSVGSLACGRSCERLNAVAIYGRLARYLVRLLFFTRRTLRSCELVVLCSTANTGHANHQSYGRMFAKFSSCLMREVRERLSAVVNDVHRTASAVRLRANARLNRSFHSKKVGQLGHSRNK